MPNKDPIKRKAYKALWYANHKDEAKAWRVAHCEDIAAYRRSQWLAHPEVFKARNRAFNLLHALAVKLRKHNYYVAHREAELERNRVYRRGHPRPSSVDWQRREARKRGLPATLTAVQWTAIAVAYNHRCAYCGKKPRTLTQDHVIPLVRGGGTTPDNIVPACRSCNSHKGVGAPDTIPAVRLLL